MTVDPQWLVYRAALSAREHRDVESLPKVLIDHQGEKKGTAEEWYEKNKRKCGVDKHIYTT